MKLKQIKSGWLAVVLLVLAGAVWLVGPGSQSVTAQTAVRIFGTLGGAAKAIAVDSTGRLRVIIESGGAAFTEAVTITMNALGVTSTRGLTVQNTTAAAAGAQQYSPMTCQVGQGWKTDATAGSQSVEFCWEVVPVQGTTAPSGNYLLKASINGGAFSTVGTFTSGGQWLSPDGTAALPAWSFALDPDTGVFRGADNSLDVTAAGSARMRAGSGGVVIAEGLNFSAAGALGSPDIGVVRSSESSLRLGSSTNPYLITIADWGTTNSAEAVSVADAAVLTGPTSGAGFLVVSIGTDNNVCTFALTGTSAPVEINDPGTLCSVTALTASSINVYYSSGYKIENLRGGTRALRIQLIGG